MGESWNSHVYDCEIFGCVLEPQNHLLLSLDTPGHCIKPRTNPNLFLGKCYVINLEMLDIEKFDLLLEKAGADNPNDPFNIFLKILAVGSTSSRKHEM